MSDESAIASHEHALEVRSWAEDEDCSRCGRRAQTWCIHCEEPYCEGCVEDHEAECEEEEDE